MRWIILVCLLAGCDLFDKPAPPACQGDPIYKPCTCLDPRTPGCYPVLDDTKQPDGGVR